jgi:hypothetical protein
MPVSWIVFVSLKTVFPLFKLSVGYRWEVYIEQRLENAWQPPLKRCLHTIECRRRSWVQNKYYTRDLIHIRVCTLIFSHYFLFSCGYLRYSALKAEPIPYYCPRPPPARILSAMHTIAQTPLVRLIVDLLLIWVTACCTDSPQHIEQVEFYLVGIMRRTSRC